MTSTWEPYREPLWFTLARTIGIAVVVGGVFAWRFGALKAWPIAFLIVFWFSFGGHWVEVLFLNWLRPKLPRPRTWQVPSRFAVWFAGGVCLGFGMIFTRNQFDMTRALRTPSWWIAGLIFIGVELIAHAFLAMFRRPNFYNGKG